MARALVDADYVKAWAPSGAGDPDVTVLDRCIEAASDWLESVTNRRWLKATFTEYHDGLAALGRNQDELWLSAWPLTYPADAVTVTENGAALVVAEGYAPSANVLVESGRGILRKQVSTIGSQLAEYGFPAGSCWMPGRE